MREGGWDTKLELTSEKRRAQRPRRKSRKKKGKNDNMKLIFKSDNEERTTGKEMEPYDCL